MYPFGNNSHGIGNTNIVSGAIADFLDCSSISEKMDLSTILDNALSCPAGRFDIAPGNVYTNSTLNGPYPERRALQQVFLCN